MSAKADNSLLCDPEIGVCECPIDGFASKSISEERKTKKPIRIIYYTDPICSSCWGVEPQLRKLKLEYGYLLNFEYRMGGLLPDWSYNSGGISKPEDVAHHWDEVSRYYQMPIDGDVWLEDPLHSSYPPSIAFKAAQLQDEAKAITFLRHMREALFLQKKNITKWEHLVKAAKLVGLDVERLKQAYENGEAEAQFKQDLIYAKELGVRGFPSMFFIDAYGNEAFVYGYRPYRFYEEAVQKLLPGSEKQGYSRSPNWLMETFGRLMVKEFSVLSEIELTKAEAILEVMREKGDLKRIKTEKGKLFINCESKYNETIRS